MEYKHLGTVEYLGEPYSKSNAHLLKYNWKLKHCQMTYPSYVMDYEQDLKEVAMKAAVDSGQEPLTTAIRMDIDYYLKSRKVKDLPNLPKTTCDALSGTFYKDDHYICEMRISKYYDVSNPRVVINLYAIEAEDRTVYPILYGQDTTAESSDAVDTKQVKSKSKKRITIPKSAKKPVVKRAKKLPKVPTRPRRTSKISSATEV